MRVRPTILLGGLVSAVVLCAPVSNGTGQAEDDRSQSPGRGESLPETAPLDTIRAVRGQIDKPGEERAVDLECIVTYADPEWGLLFVHDGEDGTFVKTDWEAIPPIELTGKRIRLRGKSDASQLTSGVREGELQSLGDGRFPLPISIDLTDAAVEDLSSQFVALDAVVTGAVVARNRVIFTAIAGGSSFDIVVPHGLGWGETFRLVGNEVNVRGNFAAGLDSEGNPVAARIYVGSADLIDGSRLVRKPAPVRLDAISEVYSGSGGDNRFAGRSVTLTGKVILNQGSAAMFVRDRTGVVEIKPLSKHHFIPGDVVTVTGRVRPDEGVPTIDGEVFVFVRDEPAERTRAIDLDELVDPIAEGGLVTLTGDVKGVAQSPSGAKVLLAGWENRILVDIPVDDLSGGVEKLDLDSALELEASGVLLRGRDSSEWILRVGDLDDVVVLARRSVVTNRWLLIGIASFAVFALIATSWGLTLRIQVRSQTQDLRDQTERLIQSENALAATTALLSASYQAIREAVIIVGRNGEALEVNDRFFAIFGLPVGPPPKDVFGELAPRFSESEQFQRYWATCGSDASATGTTQWTLEGCEAEEVESFTAPVLDVDGTPIGRVWVFRDLTEQRSLEKSLVQAQKMEAVGRLAGGVAHDFNNLLTGISGNLAVAKFNREKPLEASLPAIDAAESAANRAAELVQRLLGFSRKATLELKPHCINEVVDRLVAFLRSSIDPSVVFDVRPETDLWTAKVDGTQIEQVLLNLCMNSVDAMPGGGTITISTHNTESSRDSSSDVEDYVELRVSDDGAGMDETVIAKIFEPFFTTKEQGKGTGLGLAMAYGILEQHGGWITCASTPGVGTVFRVFLPRCAQSSGVPLAEPKGGQGLPPARAGEAGESVLIVDDEAVVRAVTEGVLRHHGYEVETAGNGREGLDLLASDPGRFQLVLLDLTMPVMSGKETLRAIRASYPRLPVIICSGYLVDLESFAAETGVRPDAVIQKPFDVGVLTSICRDVLDGGERSRPEVARPA